MKSVLLLPGYACTSSIWEPLISELPDIRFIRVDWPQSETPAWHTVAQFSDWVASRYSDELGTCSLIAGHSMGGLVALDLCNKLHKSSVVLVESFLVTPPPYFRNLLFNETPDSIKRDIEGQLQRCRPFFSPELQSQLRMVNLALHPALSRPIRCAVVYGTRKGEGEEIPSADLLEWPPSLKERLGLYWISRSCHFPMLENSVDTATVFRTFLDQP